MHWREYFLAQASIFEIFSSYISKRICFICSKIDIAFTHAKHAHAIPVLAYTNNNIISELAKVFLKL